MVKLLFPIHKIRMDWSKRKNSWQKKLIRIDKKFISNNKWKKTQLAAS